MVFGRALAALSLAGLLVLMSAGAGAHGNDGRDGRRGGDAFWGTGDDPVLSRCYSLEQPGVNCDAMTDSQRQDYVDNDGDAPPEAVDGTGGRDDSDRDGE